MPNNTGMETFTLDDGTKLSLRHITPDDAAKEQAFVRKLSAQSRYFRFHGSIKELNKNDLEKFTNPDPLDSEALIVLHGGGEIEEEIGVARFSIDQNGVSCEFAIVVADEWQKRGVGMKLMKSLINHAESRGIKRIYGSVLENNRGMRRFAEKLGFEETKVPGDDSLQITKNL